jgi:hypothetical protein
VFQLAPPTLPSPPAPPEETPSPGGEVRELKKIEIFLALTFIPSSLPPVPGGGGLGGEREIKNLLQSRRKEIGSRAQSKSLESLCFSAILCSGPLPVRLLTFHKGNPAYGTNGGWATISPAMYGRSHQRPPLFFSFSFLFSFSLLFLSSRLLSLVSSWAFGGVGSLFCFSFLLFRKVEGGRRTGWG